MTRRVGIHEAAALAVLLGACAGPAGTDGQDGRPCSVVALDGGGVRILCADGTTAVLPGGAPGAPGPAGAAGDAGTSCSVVQLDAGLREILCSDGTSVIVSNGTNGSNGSNGTNGTSGSNGTNGTSLGVNVTAFHGAQALADAALLSTGKVPAAITITSATADATGHVAVTFQVRQTFLDGGSKLLSTIPAPKFTVAKLVPAAVGEASNHWVPYITRTASVPASATGYANPPGTVVLQANRETNGVLTNLGDGGYSYAYATVLSTARLATDGGLIGFDPALTHRVAILLGGAAGATGSAAFDFVPSGAPVTETRDIVRTAACRECHGAGFSAHSGDRTEVQVCVTCHNPTSVDAYSNNNVEFRQLIHNIHAGGQKASVAGPDGLLWDNPATAVDESADNQPFTIGPTPQDWWKLEFPSILSNCTKCHQGAGANVDAWKTRPGQAACFSCHDTTDVTNPGTTHPGGQQTNDAFCAGCHTASGGVTSVLVPIPAIHDWTARDPRLQSEFVPTITLTPPPANGQFYVAGEAPAVKVVLTDVETGLPVDSSTLVISPTGVGCPSDGGACPPRNGLITKAVMLVHGPRALNTAVLTRAARAAVVAPAAGPWNLSAASGSLIVQFDQGFSVPSTNQWGGDVFLPGKVTVAATNASGGSLTFPDGGAFFQAPAAATRDEVVAWLNANASFAARGVAYLDEKTATLALRSRNLGPVYAVQLQASSVATAAFAGDLTLHVPGGSTPTNRLARLADGGVDDPRVTYSGTSLLYQLDPVDDLSPGTYTVGLEISGRGKLAGNAEAYKTPSVGFASFQVGTATPELPVARNCNTCHQSAGGTGMIYDPVDHHKILGDTATNQCTGCHDYQPQDPTAAAWSGALPISRRVHAVHDGENLAYPNTTVGHADPVSVQRHWGVLYPQDIRTCETCHVPGTTSGSWVTNANRLACGGCHDADDATAHIRLMTYDPTPAAPYSGDEVQACTVCH